MVASSGSGSRDGGNSGKSRGGGGGGGDDGGGGSQQTVKKGPWTTAEDAILIEYVRKHGEGNWNAVQRNSGLLRCGKSCRLRWANHLRPNLKRGSFSPEEESLIIELHAKLGNKWARMASQLPGRTDNEIKNYWNTRVKRLQRAGLPIYPDEIPLQYDQPQLLQRNRNFSSPSFSSLLSSSSSSSQFSSNSKFSPSLSLFNPFNYPTMANPLQPGNSSSFLSNPNHQFKPFHEDGSGSSFSLPLTSPILPFSPSPPSLYNYPLQFSPRPIMGGSFNGGEIELPSIQSPLLAVTTPPSSGSICGDHYMIETPSDADEYYIAPEVPNSGLLDALVEESKSLAQAENLKKELSFPAGKDKAIWVSDTGLSEDAADGFHGSSSAHSSIGMKADEPLEDMNPIDDDLSSLLNNFPLTVPLPDWYDASPNNSNGQSSNMNNGNSGLNNQPEASPSPLATTNPKWSNMGSSCSWNNMPGIC